MNNDPEVKMFSTTRIIFATFGLLLIILSPASSATTLYSVSLDTSNLVDNATGPFTLDFSLRDGSGNANNTVHLIDFNFLEGSFTLTDASSPNEVKIQFRNLNRLSFRIDTTNNLDSPTPDSLIFRILDRNSNPIPTTDLTMSDTFLTLALNSATGAVLGYGTDSNRTTIAISAPTVRLLSPINVPEPSPLLLLVIGLSNLLMTRCSLGIRP
jgi:hypothetical protein